MIRWFGRALLVVTFLSAATSAIRSAPAASLRSVAEPASSSATEISSRTSNRHPHSHRVDHRPLRPQYYERPYYYTPYPYSVPAPFVFGFGPWVNSWQHFQIF
jgi:hypothetical protein